jgi:predicted nucleic acid-binding protein
MTLRCADTSAWHHATDQVVASAWRAALDADEVGMCDQVRLEILYSARSADDYDSLSEELGALRPISMTEATFTRALEVQRSLAHVGGLHHRSAKIADLLIAAAAEAAGAIVWHYDEDFDRIAAVTGQPVEWVAPRGTL